MDKSLLYEKPSTDKSHGCEIQAMKPIKSHSKDKFQFFKPKGISMNSIITTLPTVKWIDGVWIKS